MNEPIAIIWQRPDGCFAWLGDDMHEALATICEDMQGETDEAISAAITAYLASLTTARKATLN